MKIACKTNLSELKLCKADFEVNHCFLQQHGSFDQTHRGSATLKQTKMIGKTYTHVNCVLESEKKQ